MAIYEYIFMIIYFIALFIGMFLLLKGLVLFSKLIKANKLYINLSEKKATFEKLLDKELYKSNYKRLQIYEILEKNYKQDITKDSIILMKNINKPVNEKEDISKDLIESYIEFKKISEEYDLLLSILEGAFKK